MIILLLDSLISPNDPFSTSLASQSSRASGATLSSTNVTHVTRTTRSREAAERGFCDHIVCNRIYYIKAVPRSHFAERVRMRAAPYGVHRGETYVHSCFLRLLHVPAWLVHVDKLHVQD